ncbi:MAG: ligase-associated DNA damage response endonuclease PdeM [Bacteroidia bacterium]
MHSKIFKLKNQTLRLLPEKALYWQEQKLLLLADVHLGKAGHFRKAGIPVSSDIHWADLYRLTLLMKRWKPERVIFLGDLFHSDKNQEWEIFREWLLEWPQTEFILVKGNHEFLPDADYSAAHLQIVSQLEMQPFLFVHQPPPEADEAGRYALSGHIHPGVKLWGAGRQSLRLPCFYFHRHYAILPAFGHFTGLALVKPIEAQAIFAIADEEVIDLSRKASEKESSIRDL